MVILDTTIKIEVIGHYVKEVSKMSKKFNRTPAEEILLSVQQWYLSRGLRVPADELKICKDDIEKERILNEYNGAVFTKRLLEYQHDLIKEEGGDDYYEKAANLIERIAAQNKIIAGTSEALLISGKSIGRRRKRQDGSRRRRHPRARARARKGIANRFIVNISYYTPKNSYHQYKHM